MARKLIKKSKNYFLWFILLFFVIITTVSYFPKDIFAAFTFQSVTISDSRAGATAVGYNFLATASANTAIKQINIKFCTQAGAFADTCTAPTGFDAASATRGSDNISGTGRSDTPATNTFQTVITTPSTQSPLAIQFNLAGITNPTTVNTTFYARIKTYSDTGTTTIDDGQVLFAVLNTGSIAVTATVDPNFTFTLAGVASSQSVNGATTTIDTSGVPNTLPLGNLTGGSAAIGAHDITITTNAQYGFQVTVNQVGANPLSVGSANFDAFTGTYASPTSWSAPNGTQASINTGFFGYTTNDTVYSQFQSDKWAGTETTPRAFMSSTIGQTSYLKRIGWQAQINAIQPPGAYTGTMILVATPTY